ncbi:MAG: hypothetical protein V7L11_22155 [Nostoc sp.]
MQSLVQHERLLYIGCIGHNKYLQLFGQKAIARFARLEAIAF